MEAPTEQSRTGEGPVDRAFHLLQVVVAAGEPVGVRELGRRTGLPRSTASRLVATLERLRMVSRDSSGGIVAGSALATLHTGASATPLLRDRLQPLLVELTQSFGENAALALDDGDRLLYISQVASEHPVSVQDVTGERHPFHLVAPGLVAMAHWNSDRLDTHLSDSLGAATSNSMTSPGAIRERLRKVRRDGYAWTDQELDLGINGVAVPVIISEELAATVSLFGPSYRFSESLQPDLGPRLGTLVSTRIR